jgi:hypothetical protein
MSALVLALAWILLVQDPRPSWMYVYFALASILLVALRVLVRGDD